MNRRGRKRYHPIRTFFSVFFTMILLCGGVLFYAFKIEPNLLTVKEIDLSSESPSGRTMTVVQLSDLEISKAYSEDKLPDIIRRVNSFSPDIIVFTGDLFSNYAEYSPEDEVENALSQMTAKVGKYAVYGNNDYGGGAAEEYEDIMENAGFLVLINSSQTIGVADKTVVIGGLDDDTMGSPDLDQTFDGGTVDADYTILLSHEPYVPDHIEDYGVNLILSGHTHGGQVSIPFLSSPLAQGEYVKGLYTLEDQNGFLFVSNGFGTSRLAVRFLAPPQIAVFHIAL